MKNKKMVSLVILSIAVMMSGCGKNEEKVSDSECIVTEVEVNCTPCQGHFELV